MKKDFFSRKNIDQMIQDALDWIDVFVFDWTSLAQIGAIVVASLVALALAPMVRRLAARIAGGGRFEAQLARARRLGRALTFPALWLIVLWLGALAAESFAYPSWLIETGVSLLTAWVVIRVASAFIRDASWARAIAIMAWALAALNVVGLLDPLLKILDDAAITLGDLKLSALGLIKGVLTLAVLLWLANLLSRLLETRIRTLPSLTPSVQVLFAKLLKIVLITIAVVAALSSVGIDLTAFAVFSGAIGVGVGFGLQKVVANLISGIILLIDKSVKPGDVIAVGDTYGRIDSLNARYTSVVTLDGIEHLIPNEDLIGQRVENWSHSHNRLRLKVPVGVSYGADVQQAIALCIEAAGVVDRVMKDPAPACLLRGFGDSSVDLEIRFWINDPMNGDANVISEVLLGVWERFHEHDVEIPFPQRDLHIRSPEQLRVLSEGVG